MENKKTFTDVYREKRSKGLRRGDGKTCSRPYSFEEMKQQEERIQDSAATR